MGARCAVPGTPERAEKGTERGVGVLGARAMSQPGRGGRQLPNAAFCSSDRNV